MNKKLFLFSLLSVFVCLCFTSCTDDSKVDNTTTATAGPCKITARLPADPGGLNPVYSSSGYSRQIQHEIFLPLIEFDPDDLKMKPVLAKTLPVITEITEGEFKGGVSYTYEIHDEAVWDNGKPVTAHDYVFTVKMVLNPTTNTPGWRGYLSNISEVEIDPDNNKKFVVYTKEPYILALESTGNWYIYPEYHYDANQLLRKFTIRDFGNAEKLKEIEKDTDIAAFVEEFKKEKYLVDVKEIIGCGPYRLEKWDSGTRLDLRKKENWWGDQLMEKYPLLRAYPEELVFKIIPEPATAVAELKNGAVDIMAEIPPEMYVELGNSDFAKDKLTIATAPLMKYYYIGLNNKSPKLEDKRVRRALAHMLDLDQGQETLMKGMADRVVGPVHPSKSYYNETLKPVPFDLSKAKSLFAEAGWKDTNGNGILDKKINGRLTEFKLQADVTRTPLSRDIVLLLQQNGKEVGIEVELLNRDFKEVVKDIKARKFELVMLAAVRSPSDDDFFQFWHTSSDTPNGYNRVSFGNAVSDKLIEDIRSTLDPARRKDLYNEFQQLLYDEQPMIFLYAPLERLGYAKRISGKLSDMQPGYFPATFKCN